MYRVTGLRKPWASEYTGEGTNDSRRQMQQCKWMFSVTPDDGEARRAWRRRLLLDLHKHWTQTILCCHSLSSGCVAGWKRGEFWGKGVLFKLQRQYKHYTILCMPLFCVLLGDGGKKEGVKEGRGGREGIEGREVRKRWKEGERVMREGR